MNRMKNRVLHLPFSMLLILSATILCANYAPAQIGVGTTTPHPSSMMHISAGAGNNKGLIMPKISSASRVVLDSTQNIAHGLVFFDTDLQKFYYFHQSPKQWFELDHDWIRKDVAGASPVVGTHIYSGVPGNVGIGTASTINPGSKLTVVGNLAVGSANYTQDSVAPANGATFGTWVGVGTRTQTSGMIFNVKGNARVQGNEVVTGQMTASRFSGEGVVPTGGIIMWSGTVTGNFTNGLGLPGTEYDGWALCDGRNGTPDLRGRFVVGMSNSDGNNYSYTNSERNLAAYNTQGNSGGERTHVLTVGEMPSHDHSGNTTSDGSHTHVTFRNNTTDNTGAGQVADSDVADGTSGADIESGTNGDGTVECRTESGGTHNHTISSQGGGSAHENRPPYFVLAYIMKLP
jgi:microcystin-dependent protein